MGYTVKMTVNLLLKYWQSAARAFTGTFMGVRKTLIGL